MSWARVISARLRGLLRRKRWERDLDDEIRFHLEAQAEDNLKGGMDPAEARYAALRSFGARESMKEKYWGAKDNPRGGNCDSRHTLCAPHAPQEPEFYGNRCRCTCPGDWRKHGNVQCIERRSAPAASIPVAGAVGDVVDRDSESKSARGPIGVLERRAVAQPKRKFR